MEWKEEVEGTSSLVAAAVTTTCRAVLSALSLMLCAWYMVISLTVAIMRRVMPLSRIW